MHKYIVVGRISCDDCSDSNFQISISISKPAHTSAGWEEARKFIHKHFEGKFKGKKNMNVYMFKVTSIDNPPELVSDL